MELQFNSLRVVADATTENQLELYAMAAAKLNEWLQQHPDHAIRHWQISEMRNGPYMHSDEGSWQFFIAVEVMFQTTYQGSGAF